MIYHYSGQQYIPFLKKLDVFDKYKIYSLYMANQLALKHTAFNKRDILIPFFDWSIESMADFYWRFKDKIVFDLK